MPGYFPAWDANMAAPAGGFTAGALLAPNYLQRLIARGGEEAPYYERITLDPSDVEGSFRASTGMDIRAALRDVAPGFDPGAGPITIETLERQVPYAQQRAPSASEGIGPLALLAPAVFGIAAWAAAGAGAGAATAAEAAAIGAPQMPPAIMAPEAAGFVPAGTTASGGTIFAPAELAASSWGGLTAQQIASGAQTALKLGGALAPALAASQLSGSLAARQASAPIATRAVGGSDFGGTVTEQEQQQAPQSNSGSVPPTITSGTGGGGAILAIAVLIFFALTKG